MEESDGQIFEIVPYRLMKRYGDDALVRENYEAMKTMDCNMRLRGHRKTKILQLQTSSKKI